MVKTPKLGFVPRGRHLFVYDVLAALVAVIGAFALRFDASNVLHSMAPYLPVALLPVIIQPVTNYAYGLYRREWRYASLREVFGITAAVGTAAVVNTLLFLAAAEANLPGTAGFPRSFWPLEALLALTLIGGGRLGLRWYLETNGRSGGTDEERGIATLVYGAGEAGVAVTRMSQRHDSLRLRIVGFLDDDPSKRRMIVMGQPIYGTIADLAAAVHRTGARQLVVAMPSAPGATIRRAVESGRALELEVRVVPALSILMGDPGHVVRLRPVQVEDLLRREPVKADLEGLAGYLNGMSVLVTGAGGSIGSELCRQILSLGPRMLVAADNSEYALWQIERELRERNRAQIQDLHATLVDVRSRRAIDRLMATVRPNVVFHAAALKHVPICEIHPSEAALTNVLGTRNVLASAETYGVDRLVLISTDKAVRSSSVMGATKRAAELLTTAAAQRSGRPFVTVRFGNVLGSSGSVVPIFEEQITRGLPVTITHPDATRYFMTIPEAVTLILQAASVPEIGETYVLDMGEPVRILDLARDIARMAGKDPDQLEIRYTGLRPGERLHETLLFDGESVTQTSHERIWRTKPDASVVGAASELVDDLVTAALERDDRGVRENLARMGVLHVGEAAVPAKA